MASSAESRIDYAWAGSDATAAIVSAARDLAASVSRLFFLPGDLAIQFLTSRAPPVASWLGIEPSAAGGVASAVVSCTAWLAALIAISIAGRALFALDRRLTYAVRRFVGTARLRARIAHTVFRHRFRTWLAAPRRAVRPELAHRIDLTPPQLVALRLHAAIAPGYALSVSDVAKALRARRHATQELLDGLADLGLLGRTLGGAEGESAYTLTVGGRALLAFHGAGERKTPAPAAP